MKIENRLELTIAGIFLIGWLILLIFTIVFELKNARVNNVRLAKVMMSTASATRDYTSEQIAPLLSGMTGEDFIKEKVPAHGGQQVFNNLGQYVDEEGFVYVERAMNPTNPKDMAEEWQVELIRHFSKNPDLKEVIDTRNNRSGINVLYIAEPIRITSASCLECHGDPELAPPDLIKTYGRERGFGWQLGETVGTRIVTVPTSVCIERAYALIVSYAILSGSIFLLVYVAISIMIRKWLTQPLEVIIENIDEASVSQSAVDAKLPKVDCVSLEKLNKAIKRLLFSLNKSRLPKKS